MTRFPVGVITIRCGAKEAVHANSENNYKAVRTVDERTNHI